MNKIHHPTNRAERLKIKFKKENTFDIKSKRSRVAHRRTEIEAKELEDELRIEVSSS
jgi:hypothetical protein